MCPKAIKSFTTIVHGSYFLLKESHTQIHVDHFYNLSNDAIHQGLLFHPVMLTGSTSIANTINISSFLWSYINNNHQHSIIIIGIVTTAIAIPVRIIVGWEIFLWFTFHICQDKFQA